MTVPAKQIVETEYEVKLGVFEGPLDLLLYLVQKNELDPREIAISTITDQYLAYLDSAPGNPGIKDLNLSNAGEFLVMAARLMRLKARELLPADQKDELEDMEYELDRQALIQQMLEYQKFKEAARVLRNFESRNFGAYGRGRVEGGEEEAAGELEEEAGVFDLLAAFRSVVMQKPKAPVHEVEIDDVTIEDKMQEVEVVLNERGRSQFEDLFADDQRTIVQVVTLMAILELAKLDRIVFRQSHSLGPIWVYRKQGAAAFELELKVDEAHLEPLPEFREGLVQIVQEQIKKRAVQNALEEALRDLENGIQPADDEPEADPTADTAGQGADGPDAVAMETVAAGAAEMPEAEAAGMETIGAGIGTGAADAEAAEAAAAEMAESAEAAAAEMAESAEASDAGGDGSLDEENPTESGTAADSAVPPDDSTPLDSEIKELAEEKREAGDGRDAPGSPGDED